MVMFSITSQSIIKIKKMEGGRTELECKQLPMGLILFQINSIAILKVMRKKRTGLSYCGKYPVRWSPMIPTLWLSCPCIILTP
jgi:hypothetical protein